MIIEENYLLRISFICSSLIIVCFAIESLLPFLKMKTKIKIKIYRLDIFYKIIFFCCLGLHFIAIIFKRELYKSEQLYLVYAVCSACGIIFFRQLSRNGKHPLFKIFYNKAEINWSLKDNESIGALWAHQTYDAYYTKTLENIMDRMNSFEEKYNVQFFTKKLLIVIPLSCHIEGIFTEKDPSIELFGNLEIVEDDAGGNINREFKNPVYKICSIKDVYIVAEYSQPVSAISRSRYTLEKEKLVYIRDCYIKTLKLLLQGSPSLLVIYDDENTSENLSSCILSAIEKERKDFTV